MDCDATGYRLMHDLINRLTNLNTLDLSWSGRMELAYFENLYNSQLEHLKFLVDAVGCFLNSFDFNDECEFVICISFMNFTLVIIN